jgi:hypothetical protein
MKDHYVPIFYQNHFGDAEGLLWVYDRKLKTYKRLHPVSICFQHDLYAFPIPDGAINQMVKTDFLAQVDRGDLRWNTPKLLASGSPGRRSYPQFFLERLAAFRERQ